MPHTCQVGDRVRLVRGLSHFGWIGARASSLRFPLKEREEEESIESVRVCVMSNIPVRNDQHDPCVMSNTHPALRNVTRGA
jgi:hypothetical protein